MIKLCSGLRNIVIVTFLITMCSDAVIVTFLITVCSGASINAAEKVTISGKASSMTAVAAPAGPVLFGPYGISEALVTHGTPALKALGELTQPALFAALVLYHYCWQITLHML